MKIYEHHTEPLISTWKFVKRVVIHHVAGFVAFALMLAGGVAVLKFQHDFPLEDAVMEASMLSTGMGPVNSNSIHTADGKYFVSLYAVFRRFGLVPIVHRLLHKTFYRRDSVWRVACL